MKWWVLPPLTLGIDLYVIMNTLFVATIVLGVCIFHVDAFLSPTQIYHPRTKISPSSSSILRQRHHHPGTFPPLHVSKEPQYPPEEKDSSSRVLLTHDDIVWKLRPPPETPFLRQVLVRLGANLIRLDCLWKGQDPPLVLCPKVGGTAVLEAHYQHTRIARFGLTTQRGPSAPPIEETVQEIYDIQQLPLGGIGAAAIIYMVVEPPYRRLGVGTLALEVIAAIHAIQGCDFTMLVADDNGSGKLVQWYETNGFTVAPQLQTLMGSPDGQFGTSMIAPTKESLSTSCRIQWW